MNPVLSFHWLKSDTAKKKVQRCFRPTNYFNLDHSITESLLEWNGKVLDETSTFSIRDFVLNKDNGGTMSITGESNAKEDGNTSNDVRLNISQNNREDEYYRMNGQQSTAREQGQNGYQPTQQYQYEQANPEEGSALSSTSYDEAERKKKKADKKSKFSGWESIKARNHFISKVFVIVLALLIYNFGLMCLFIFIEPITNFARRYWWMWIIFLVCYLPFCLAISCSKTAARKSPLNYILLFFAATFFGLALGCMAAYYDVIEVLLAVGVTILVVLILALIAIFSPCDFTILIGVVAVILLAMFGFGILMIFFYAKWLHILYCSIGVLVFSLMIVIDIQMICGGKNRRIQYSEKDYAVAALTLYVDVACLLMMILGLTGAAR